MASESCGVNDQIWMVTGPRASAANLLLAHGAGAGMETPFMNQIADLLAAAKIRTIRFNFPYMARALAEGRRRPPDRMPVLSAAFSEALGSARREFGGSAPWFIGGKSMGGRVASMIAPELDVAGVVCLGYPFHPPGKPDKLRTAHLEMLEVTTLICQGDRDKLGNAQEVSSYSLSPAIHLCWLPDGDHDLKPRKKSGHTHEENLAGAATAIRQFMVRVN